MGVFEKANEAAEYIKSQFDLSNSELAIFTGTGLNSIVSLMSEMKELPYEAIPYLEVGSIKSHTSKLVFGQIEGRSILVFVGRLHYYEGFSMDQITFPIRIVQMLNIKNVLFTNATGGLNEKHEAGDIALVSDHIYLMPENPLRGQNDDRLGLRFPDMSEVYNLDLRKKIKHSAEALDVKLHDAVYVCWQGPSLETPAEYTYLNTIGADVVGMSTIPEVIVAKHAGLNVAMLSIITNVCFPPSRVTQTSIEEVINVANEASELLNKLIFDLVKNID